MPEAFLLILSQIPGDVLEWFDSSQASKAAESLKWRVWGEVSALTGFEAEGEAVGGGRGVLRAPASFADDLVSLAMFSRIWRQVVRVGKVEMKDSCGKWEIVGGGAAAALEVREVRGHASMRAGSPAR